MTNLRFDDDDGIDESGRLRSSSSSWRKSGEQPVIRYFQTEEGFSMLYPKHSKLVGSSTNAERGHWKRTRKGSRDDNGSRRVDFGSLSLSRSNARTDFSDRCEGRRSGAGRAGNAAEDDDDDNDRGGGSREWRRRRRRTTKPPRGPILDDVAERDSGIRLSDSRSTDAAATVTTQEDSGCGDRAEPGGRRGFGRRRGRRRSPRTYGLRAAERYYLASDDRDDDEHDDAHDGRRREENPSDREFPPPSYHLLTRFLREAAVDGVIRIDAA